MPGDLPSPFDRPAPPEQLRIVYRLLASRYAQSTEPLDRFGGRWMALRADSALRPRALPVLDDEPGAFNHQWRQFRLAAVRLADSVRLVYVRIELGRIRSVETLGEKPQLLPALRISVEPSVGGWGLTGVTALLADGRSGPAGRPLPLYMTPVG